MDPRPIDRLISLYLPQFHPIPENDRWWGDGFTEWVNVRKARPLFPGHVQPRRPGELGYYDLRDPDVREAQARLARAHGIEAFCYYHYWFAGHRLLERPFQEVLTSGRPDLPFCIAWANVPWTAEWAGDPRRILIQQTYPPGDARAHFEALLPAFRDPRYVRVEGRPLVYVFHADRLPPAYLAEWRALARRAGLPGLHVVGNKVDEAGAARLGMDACSYHFVPWKPVREYHPLAPLPRAWRRVQDRIRRRPAHLPYPDVTAWYHGWLRAGQDTGRSTGVWNYPVALAGWDNTPRLGARGLVLSQDTAEAWARHLQEVRQTVAGRPREHRIVFLKAWNEWAEGDVLEPEEGRGRAWLEVVRRQVLPG